MCIKTVICIAVLHMPLLISCPMSINKHAKETPPFFFDCFYAYKQQPKHVHQTLAQQHDTKNEKEAS